MARKLGIQPSPERNAWVAMKSRCYGKSTLHKEWEGRGIRVCNRWLESFDNFLADVGPRTSPEHSLDRFPDQNGDYRPGNVRWALPEEQQNNRRCNTHITAFNKTMTQSQWARERGLSVSTIHNRLVAGYTPEEALSQSPLRPWARLKSPDERIRSTQQGATA